MIYYIKRARQDTIQLMLNKMCQQLAYSISNEIYNKYSLTMILVDSRRFHMGSTKMRKSGASMFEAISKKFSFVQLT